MPKKGENIYKRKDGRWEGRYIKNYLADGKAQYAYVYGKTYSEAKQKLLDGRIAHVQRTEENRSRIKYKTLLQKWLAMSRLRIKESTYSRYVHLANMHILPHLGEITIDRLTTQMIEQHISFLLSDGRVGCNGGLAPKTASDILTIIKGTIDYARCLGYQINCYLDRLIIKKTQVDMRVLSTDEQRQLLSVLLSHTDLPKLGVLLCLYTGMRIGEVCALRWENINFSEGVLCIRDARLGIWGSPWVGLANFERMFISPDAIRAIRNTLVISLGRLMFQFPVPILLALLINEMSGTKLKRVYQTVLTFPHFLSWVIVAAILNNFLSNTGALNSVITDLGGENVNFLTNSSIFRPILYITANWKEMGYSSIIYLAAIASVDPSLHEAATVDGAGRLRRIWHVTLPGIRQTIIVLFIMQVGKVMNAGFDQIFYMYNPAVKGVSDIIDTYVYSITFLATPSYSFSAAVGMFKSVINFILLILADKLIKLFGGTGMFT